MSNFLCLSSETSIVCDGKSDPQRKFKESRIYGEIANHARPYTVTGNRAGRIGPVEVQAVTVCRQWLKP